MILKVHLLSGKTGLSCKIIYLLHLVFIYHSTCSSCSPAVSDNGSGICLDNCHETVAFCIWWTKRLSRAYLLGSLRLIIQPIMVSNFPFSLIEMIRYTKRLDEDWNHSGSHYLFIYILFFFLLLQSANNYVFPLYTAKIIFYCRWGIKSYNLH